MMAPIYWVCSSADDGDGCRVPDVKAQQRGQAEGEEDAELCRRAENHQLGIGQQGREIDHGADAHKQQQREQLIGNARVKQDIQDAHLGDAVNDLRHRTGQGQVDQNGAESDGQQQRGFHLLFDGQIDQQGADDPHDNLLPLDVEHISE